MGPLGIFLVINAIFRGSLVSGLDVEHTAAYDRVIECMSVTTHAFQPGEEFPFETVICTAFKVWDKFLFPVFKVTRHPPIRLNSSRSYSVNRIC